MNMLASKVTEHLFLANDLKIMGYYYVFLDFPILENVVSKSKCSF